MTRRLQARIRYFAHELGVFVQAKGDGALFGCLRGPTVEPAMVSVVLPISMKRYKQRYRALSASPAFVTLHGGG